MRKTLIAIALGATALIAAACGGSGTSSTPGVSAAPLESTPVESIGASPSMEVLPSESPASS